MVMVPDGCAALITRFGKLEQVVGPGRIILLNPWKRVSYILNTTREYPFNAPVREAPTKGGVKASIDLFIQFRISDPVEFVYTLGAVRGFEEKLGNAVSETIRSLIYEQLAADIYNMVGEKTGRLLDQLNQQFRPAVELPNANITHAEPSDRKYRVDLAAPEMVRVAKESAAYEQEWGLTRKRRIDQLQMDIERAKKVRDARIVEVKASLNKAREQVAQLLEEQETNAQRVRFEIETRGRSGLIAAENEAKAQQRLAQAYRDNRAVLQYELALRRLEVGAELAGKAPQPVVVRTDGDGGADTSALATLLAAQLLPRPAALPSAERPAGGVGNDAA
ncbi:SPFH domain-containing protein [Actinoplanes philippinensis]|uniref:SPFH domain-containing protein n=1 Tax=Actinoplanes philippinensis TaxID=35752 RepID=UPI0033CD94BC